MTTKGDAKAWLLAHVDYQDDSCLLWPFYRSKLIGRSGGRAYMMHEGKKVLTHRVMCRLVHGEAPEGKPNALHSCSNGHLGCINPKHLYWGDLLDNASDMIAAGNSARGARSWENILTEDQVREIRAIPKGTPYAKISEKYGIAAGSVWHVQNRKIWKWLD